MLTHLSIGPLTVPTYQFLTLLGFWAGMWFSAKTADKLGIDGDHVYNTGLYGLLAGLVGGRFWYVLSHWEAYAPVPMQALALTANAIAVPEAILIALATAVIYAKKNRLPLPTFADALAPGIAPALIIGGVGAFLGSDTLGTPTRLPWGVAQFGQTLHPAHLYLVLAEVVILGIILTAKINLRWPGFTFLLFAELYAAARLLLDPFFAQPTLIGNGFRLVQVSALIAMVIILAMMAWADRQFAGQ